MSNDNYISMNIYITYSFTVFCHVEVINKYFTLILQFFIRHAVPILYLSTYHADTCTHEIVPLIAKSPTKTTKTFFCSNWDLWIFT